MLGVLLVGGRYVDGIDRNMMISFTQMLVIRSNSEAAVMLMLRIRLAHMYVHVVRCHVGVRNCHGCNCKVNELERFSTPCR